MIPSVRFFFIVSLGFLYGWHSATAAGERPSGKVAFAEGSIAIPASSSFDGKAFTYRLTPLRTAPRYRVYSLSYPSPVHTDVEANNTIPAEYYVPGNVSAGDPPRPAVICLHILNGDFELVRLLCTVLAERGVPAIFFKLPYYGERSPPEGRALLLRDVRLFSACLEQSLQDVRRTVDILASRPEVDGDHIGISGISLGAILAASACGVEKRLTRAELILGGGDLLGILMHSRETRSMRRVLESLSPEQRDMVQQAIRRVDPLTHAAALRSLARRGHLAMINAREDEVVPPECTLRLARAIGMEGKVTWLEGMGHYTAMAALPDIVRDTAEFFARDLPAGVAPPPAPNLDTLSPVEVFTRVLGQGVSMLTQAPAAGTCNYLDLVADFDSGNGRKQHVSAALIIGSGGRFRLRAGPIPEVGSLALGNGEYPWMKAKDGRIFVGRKELDPARAVWGFVEPEYKIKLLTVSGAVMAMSMAPAAFEKNIRITAGQADAGERALAIQVTQGKVKGQGTLFVRRDTLVPLRLEFSGGKVKGSILFRQWRPGAVSHPGLFAEPREGEKVEVRQEDLLRMFASTFNFLMGKVQ